MPKGTVLTKSEKIKILFLHKQNFSNRSIAKQIGRSPKVINNYLKNPRMYNKKKRKGRPPIANNRIKRLIIKKASTQKLSCNEISKELPIKLSISTINRVLNNCKHFKYLKKKTSPALTIVHKANRLN